MYVCVLQATVFAIIEAGHRGVFSNSSFGLGFLQTYDTAQYASIDLVSSIFRIWFNGTRADDDESIMQGSGSGNYEARSGSFSSLASQIDRVFNATETSTVYARFVNRIDSTFSLTGKYVCDLCTVDCVISESMQCFFTVAGESRVSFAIENKRVRHRECPIRCGHYQLISAEISSCPTFFVVELTKSAGSFADLGVSSNFQLELVINVAETIFDLTSISYAKPGHFNCDAVRHVGSGKRLWCTMDDMAKETCTYMTAFPSSEVRCTLVKMPWIRC